MAKRDIKTLKGAYDAFNTGDVGAVLAVFDARIQWYEPDAEGLPWAGRHSGAKAVAEEVFAVAVQAIPNLKVKTDEFFTDGDAVIVTGAFTGKGKDGKNFKTPFAHIWKMRDGKAVRHQNNTDTATLIKALGGKGGAGRRGIPRGP